MKNTPYLYIICLFLLISCNESKNKLNAQSKIESKDSNPFKFDSTSPEGIVKALIYSANEKNYLLLSSICDNKGACDIEIESFKNLKKGTVPENFPGTFTEFEQMFISIFKDAKINNKPTYFKTNNEEFAKVQLKILRGNTFDIETITLVKRNEKWFLLKM